MGCGQPMRAQVQDTLLSGEIRLPPNPAELAASERFEQLIRKFAAQYTLVILDTPPVMNLADPIFLCKHRCFQRRLLRERRSSDPLSWFLMGLPIYRESLPRTRLPNVRAFKSA